MSMSGWAGGMSEDVPVDHAWIYSILSISSATLVADKWGSIQSIAINMPRRTLRDHRHVEMVGPDVDVIVFDQIKHHRPHFHCDASESWSIAEITVSTQSSESPRMVKTKRAQRKSSDNRMERLSVGRTSKEEAIRC